MRGPFAALLRVPEGGFSWRHDLVVFDDMKGVANNTEPLLVRMGSPPERQYPPLTVPNLHRRFARTAPDAESILCFANQFGFLGHALPLRDPEPKSETIDFGDIPFGESLGLWQREVARMARLVALWELVKRANSRELSQFVEWTSLDGAQRVLLYLAVADGKVRPDLAQRMRQGRRDFWDYIDQNEDLAGPTTYCEMVVVAHEEIDGDKALMERWRHGDPVEPARYFVHREVNRRVRGHVSPTVLPFRNGEIRFFPDCLLSALYTQFMLALSGRTRPTVLCPRTGCGRYFEPAHGRQRYCDKRCQQLAYYYRKKEKGQAS